MRQSKRQRVPAPAEAARLVAHLRQRNEEERLRLSRMLHHDVSGMLAAARMDLSRLAARVAPDGNVPEELRRVDRLLEQVIGDARAAMQRLHPALIEHFGLAAALRHLVEDRCRGPGRRYKVTFLDEATGLEPLLAIAAFRTVETLLAGEATREVTATLASRRDGYLLELTLAPVPANPDPAQADDLWALRIWLESLGAAWKESSHEGTRRIELRLPRRAAAVPGEAPGQG
ncbi:MAG TPA: histidine kinase [Steroidobacteraceae bacterium]